MKYIYRSFLFTFVILMPVLVFGQGIHTEFGKNRVQYKKMKWSKYETANFITYWTDEGQALGEYALQMAERDFSELQNLMEYRVNDKIHVLVFNDLSDFRQSNAGNDDAAYHNGGITRIIDNKIYVYFNGNHSDLHRQIREGITQVFLKQMMFGDNLQEIVQNAVLMNLPEWFTGGLSSFVGEEWSTDLDNQMREYILSGEYTSFNDFTADYPALAGHSLWYFIGQNYGKSTVSNLLYLTRINRSVEQGFLFVLGNSFRQTTGEWYDFYNQRYLQEKDNTMKVVGKKIDIEHKKSARILQGKISPRAKYMAYVSNHAGRYKVLVKNIRSGETRTILKGGLRYNVNEIIEDNYPILTWNSNGELAVVFEKSDKVKLLTYSPSKKKIKSNNEVQGDLERITSADFSGRSQLVVSAIKDGRSDVFTISASGKNVRQITNDFYDDGEVGFAKLNGQEGVLFASNRDGLTLDRSTAVIPEKVKDFDVYFYPLEGEARTLSRITNTPFANERQPIQLDSLHIAWLSDENGLYNRYVGDLSGNSYPNTNYNRSILNHSAATKTGKTADFVLYKGVYQLVIHDTDAAQEFDLEPSGYRSRFMVRDASTSSTSENTDEAKETEVVDNVLVEIEEDTEEKVAEEDETIDIDGYFFQSEFDDDETPAIKVTEEEDGTTIVEPPTITFIKPKKKPFQPIDVKAGDIETYRLKYRTDYLVVQFDNSLMFDGYTNYDHSTTYYQWTPFSALFEAGIKDMMENQMFRGGVRIPFELNSPEFYLTFENKKKRLDKRFSYYRLPRVYSVGNENTIFFNVKNVTNYFETQLSFPLDVYRSIRWTGRVRSDRSVRLATDLSNLNYPTDQQDRVFMKLEYVHDDTDDLAINFKTGTRYKVYVEAAKRFDVGLRQNAEAQIYPGMMTTAGLDFRHYRSLTKGILLAGRVAGATSLGKEKMLYYMGGVDNWLVPTERNNEEINVPLDLDKFAFQTIATSMRGFRNNIRNGNSYMVLNAEVRARIFGGVMKSPFRSSSLLRNFQAIAFVDAGTAWQGLSPFSDDNPLNTTFVTNPVVNVKVNYFRNPIVVGYGLGVRSIIFGHFVRVDYAWGLETGQVQPGQLYLSLGVDF